MLDRLLHIHDRARLDVEGLVARVELRDAFDDVVDLVGWVRRLTVGRAGWSNAIQGKPCKSVELSKVQRQTLPSQPSKRRVMA